MKRDEEAESVSSSLLRTVQILCADDVNRPTVEEGRPGMYSCCW